MEGMVFLWRKNFNSEKKFLRYKRENLLLLGIANHEPKDCTSFFNPLVMELESLAERGLSEIEGNPKVFLTLVTSDLPAKKKVTPNKNSFSIYHFFTILDHFDTISNHFSSFLIIIQSIYIIF